jgi:hypothetical protein
MFSDDFIVGMIGYCVGYFGNGKIILLFTKFHKCVHICG